ncbi:hypothetical protein [Falsiporphyromonas endometrii]|uniref:Outer membrane protein beta-barrel domain-containing protein n=1 Tax=Falsiporphyromonas endometrii TaxID=1387297 RepID=A0ABV9K8C2_9PORP
MMKRKSILTTLLLIGCLFTASAQFGAYRKGFELGGSFGMNSGNGNIYTLSMINGANVSPYVFLGTGVGIGLFTSSSTSNSDDSYSKSEEVMPIPVFGVLQVNFGEPQKNVRPFIRLDGGYTFNASSNGGTKFGFMLNPQLGVQFTTGYLGVYASVGFNMQNHEYQIIRVNGPQYKDSEYLKAISLKVGLQF